MKTDGTTYELHESKNKTGESDSTALFETYKETYTGFTYAGGTTGKTSTKPGSPSANFTVKPDGTTEISLFYTRNRHYIILDKGPGIKKVEGAGLYYFGESKTVTATLEDGYTFSGWTGDKSSSDLSFLVTMNDSDINLLASASLGTYTITYDLAGGEVTPSNANPLSYTAGDESFTLVNPAKLGYTFDGWTLEGETTPKKYVTIAKGSTGNRKYTANWTMDTYGIEYILGGGSVNNSNVTTYDVTKTITLIEPSKDGYIFTG